MSNEFELVSKDGNLNLGMKAGLKRRARKFSLGDLKAGSGILTKNK